MFKNRPCRYVVPTADTRRSLDERGAFEICQVCYWEDDGQDEHDVDLVRGGPTGSLSLRQARANYREFAACEKRFVVLYVRLGRMNCRRETTELGPRPMTPDVRRSIRVVTSPRPFNRPFGRHRRTNTWYVGRFCCEVYA